MGTKENRQRVEAAFGAWANGAGDVFHLLSDDMTWTITGTSKLAGTYHGRQRFLDEAITPIGMRLSEPIRPSVEAIVAEGDRVVVLWRGHATALDGVPYDNTYSSHLRLDGGSIVEVTAFFDGPTLDALFDRVSEPVT